MADMENLTGRWNFRSGAPDYVGSFMGGQACFRKISGFPVRFPSHDAPTSWRNGKNISFT
jgi:hypothetical protein